MDTKRTLEPRLLRPPLQVLKLPSVGSGQGMLGAQGVQDSLISTEPPLEPVLSRSPLHMVTWAPPRLEPQTPPEWMLLPEKVTLLRERAELETRGSGPHTRPPRELLTAAGGRDHQQGCMSFIGRLGPWVEVVPTVYTVNTHSSFSCLGDSKAVTLLVKHSE